MNYNVISLIIEAIGAIGTIASVLWAIKVYTNENKNANLMKVKNAILELPSICNDINILLSEPFFAALGNSVAEELKKLMDDGQTLEDFSGFLLDDNKSHNYKAQAIYSGLKKCDEVSEINHMIKKVDDLKRQISIYYPGLGKAISKLLFYINRAASKTISSRVLNRSISALLDDEEENLAFKKAVEDAASTGSKELYFKELAIYITSVASAALKQGILGQRTIDLSLIMIDNTCDAFGDLDIPKLKKYKKRDIKVIKKIGDKSEKHAVEDAMAILKECKKYYKEDAWDKMIECKGRIIENMEGSKDD
ncbi:MAG: hypothetical protein SO267_01975 [Lachnospiraceae bacterium]|nr:hypothetical protein [Lachnospiraceae bacterium]